MPLQVKALMFDVYGTLFSWEGLEEAVGQMFRQKGVRVDPRAFNLFWRNRQLQYSMFNTLIDKGFEPFFSLTRKALRSAAAFHSVALTDEEEAQLTTVWLDKIEPYPDVLEGLKELKKLGYTMALLTNGNQEMVRIGVVDRLARMGFSFDACFTADMWGVYKPHPALYLNSVSKLGLQPREALHVCRMQFDVFGAKAAGLQVAWINRAKEPLEAFGLSPDFTASDLQELVKLLTVLAP